MTGMAVMPPPGRGSLGRLARAAERIEQQERRHQQYGHRGGAGSGSALSWEARQRIAFLLGVHPDDITDTPPELQGPPPGWQPPEGGIRVTARQVEAAWAMVGIPCPVPPGWQSPDLTDWRPDGPDVSETGGRMPDSGAGT